MHRLWIKNDQKYPIPPWVCVSRFKHFSDKFLHTEYRAQVLSKHTRHEINNRVLMPNTKLHIKFLLWFILLLSRFNNFQITRSLIVILL